MEIKSNIIINKPKSLTTVEGKMGVRERKVYNSLLSLIEKEPFPEKDTGKYYYTSLNEIAKITNITDWEELRDILLNKLPNTRLKIDLLNKDLSLKGIVIQLIGAIKPINKTDFKVFFVPDIIELVKNKNYTKLEMDVLSKLNSKYSLTMFEIIKRYYVSNTSYYTIPDMKLEDFKSLMGIDENQYKRVADFKRYVFNQIIKDINEKTDFNIDYELYKKNSRSFNYVRFNFNKKEVKEEIKDEAKAEELEIKNYNDFDDEIRELKKQIEMLKKKNNMLENDADILSQELDEKNVGLPF